MCVCVFESVESERTIGGTRGAEGESRVVLTLSFRSAQQRCVGGPILGRTSFVARCYISLGPRSLACSFSLSLSPSLFGCFHFFFFFFSFLGVCCYYPRKAGRRPVRGARGEEASSLRILCPCERDVTRSSVYTCECVRR